MALSMDMNKTICTMIREKGNAIFKIQKRK